MRRLDVKPVGVVQKPIISFGHDGKGPKSPAEAIGSGLALMLDLPGDVGITHHADTMRVSNEDGAIQKTGFLEPRGSSHLAIAVEREPSPECRIIGLLSARPDGGDPGAD